MIIAELAWIKESLWKLIRVSYECGTAAPLLARLEDCREEEKKRGEEAKAREETIHGQVEIVTARLEEL